MKKVSKILLIALASIGILLTNTVNAQDWSDTWFDSDDSEQVKAVKEDAMNKIVKAIPDNITLDIKEIDALNGYDEDTGWREIDRILREKVNKSLKDAGITFPINLETTDDKGDKVTITIDEPFIGVVPFYYDWDNDGRMYLDKNLNTAHVESSIMSIYSWGGSSIAATVKTINISYSDSNKRNDADQKYVDSKVKEDMYLFQNVKEFNLGGSGFDPAAPQKEILSRIKNLFNDDTLEFKSYYPEPMGRGDYDFGFEEWIIIVYKNGIAYKIIDVGNANTVKMTIPNTIEENEDAYMEYVSSLFAKSDLGKPVSMKLLDDVNTHFDEIFKFEDNKGYYEFTFADEYETKYAFKLVREEIKPITSIKLNKTNLSLVKGKTEKLTATINPSDTTDSKALTWTSSNTKVATVDANGNIKAIAAGTANITVKTSNGKTATVKVTVTNPNVPITSVKINQGNVNVVAKNTTKLTATINPSNTTQSKTLTWTSSNTKIATVDKNGVVKGIKAGTVTITVKTSNGKTASVKVTVKKATPIKSVKLNKKTLKLELNKTATVKATINPSNTTDNKTLTWSSSNKKVATVDQTGKITAVSAGTAKITVKTSNGKKATVKVTVSKINAKKAKITAIKDQTQTDKALKPSVEVKLNGKVLKNGTDYTVTYKNNKNAGKATVTVKFKGNYTGSVKSTFLIIPSKVAIKNPTTAKKSITVKYSKVSGAKYYQVAYRLKGTTKWSYTTKTKLTKLTSGKEYEVMIRAGIKSGKTVYGAWSDVKTIKVK